MNFDELQTFYKTEDGVLFSRLLSEKLLKIQSCWFKIDSQKKANFLAVGYPFNIKKIDQTMIDLSLSNQLFLNILKYFKPF